MSGTFPVRVQEQYGHAGNGVPCRLYCIGCLQEHTHGVLVRIVGAFWARTRRVLSVSFRQVIEYLARCTGLRIQQ